MAFIADIGALILALLAIILLSLLPVGKPCMQTRDIGPEITTIAPTTLAPTEPTEPITTTISATTTLVTTTPVTTTTPITTTTTTAACMNGMGAACLAYDNSDARYVTGSMAINNTACTTAPIRKSCFQSISEANAMEPFGAQSAVHIDTSPASCDDGGQICICVENGECFTSNAVNTPGPNDPDIEFNFFPYCECLPNGGVECHTYLLGNIRDPGEVVDAGILTGNMGTTHDINSEYDGPGDAMAFGRNSVHLKVVSVSCNGCASIQNNACP
ncbi:hypothetical protein Ddc_14365 [Ditylenchus destructor]|nr:hypothetical protein Ddc_14365 [Ditylenchus destructor]